MSTGSHTSCFLLLCALLCLPGAADADGTFSRRVLGLYSSGEGHTEIENPLRGGVEFVLHHLGLHLELHDLATGLPDSAATAGVRGVVVWLNSGRLDAPEAFWPWLAQQHQAGRRVVLLGELPRQSTAGIRVGAAAVGHALALLGLRAGDNESYMPLDIELVSRDSSMVEFERRLRYELRRFTEVRSIDPANEVLLQLRMRSTGALADAVVLGPGGGYAAAGYILHRDPDRGLVQWRLNPFRFFERALGIEGAPRPDPTTRFGHRVYYSHIDGDGLRNRSRIDPQRASGEVVLEDILKAYPDWPFTVSVITAEVDPQVFGSPAIVRLARRMFALPNVEAASHTFSHPLIWDRSTSSESSVIEYGEEMENTVPSGRALLPWRIPGYSFDPVAETVGSCRHVDALLPPGKTCDLVLWSGNCLPSEAELAALDAAGILNMNGGDSRFDGDYPSYYYVRPYYRQVGAHYQVHSSNSNENTYTGLWSGPFGGYLNAIQTFENTESPRRVLPVNIYYHFYSGEQEAAMHALHRAYEWAVQRRAELHPVFASDYARSVLDYIDTRIDSAGARTWRVRDYGTCRTVRFDGDVGVPDLGRSRGVLGYRRHQDALYVHLDDGGDALIALGGGSAADTGAARAYLEASTAPLHDVDVAADGSLSFSATSLGPSTVTWRHAPGSYRLRWRAADGVAGGGSITAAADGRLVLELPADADLRVDVRPAAD